MVRLSRKLDPSQTGIEAEKLHGDLRKLVVGQEEAVNQIVNINQTFRSGMTSPGRPIGNFLFLGPTGTGKTRLVEATAYITVSTTAPTTAALAHPKLPGVPWYAAGGATLACLLLFGIPVRRRRWRSMLGMLAFLAFLVGGASSCGGGGGGSSTPPPPTNPGTTPGAYAVTVTATSGTVTASIIVSLTVQ